jgi:hypothetical protein
VSRRSGLLELLEGLELVALEQAILDRAADPFPTSISTLDAVHLATALAIRDDLPSVVSRRMTDRLATLRPPWASRFTASADGGCRLREPSNEIVTPSFHVVLRAERAGRRALQGVP